MANLIEHHGRFKIDDGAAGYVVRVLGWIALAVWDVVRFTTLAVLIVFEPLVSAVLSVAALLFIGMALFLKYGYGALPHFHFVPMLLVGITCAVALLGYYVVIRVLMGR